MNLLCRRRNLSQELTAHWSSRRMSLTFCEGEGVMKSESGKGKIINALSDVYSF